MIKSTSKVTPKKRKERPITTDKKVLFVQVLSECCNVGRASEAVKINRKTAYMWRDKDPEFAKAWDAALRVGISALEDEAHRRAFDGVEEPVFYQGEACGAIRKYSDTLAIFLLKAHNPEKYRDNAKLELSGRVEMADTILAARARGNKDA